MKNKYKYILMCGGEYEQWQSPRHFIEYQGETLVGRTIRLLRENGITDIAISSDDVRFKRFGVPVMVHKNDYYAVRYNESTGHWCDCFYPTSIECCYLFGDVLFSDKAIKTIVEYETEDIMLFGSKPPFASNYPKIYIEPFAFKVSNQKHLHQAIKEVKRIDQEGGFKRKPIAWELWSIIKGTNPNEINYDYCSINDYTCDIDYPYEIPEVVKHD